MSTLYRDFDNQAQIDAQYNPAIKLADPSAPVFIFLPSRLAGRCPIYMALRTGRLLTGCTGHALLG